MGSRTLYPHPECPKCGNSGSGSSYIKNTYYTKNQEIVRMRKCLHCDFRWWTYQEQEVNLSPSAFQVSLPKFTSAEKRVTLKRL